MSLFRMRPHRTAILLATLLVGSACGLAERAAERFIDDEQVTLLLRHDRSGTLVRNAQGVDVEVYPAEYFTGDTVTNGQALAVLVFSIDASLQPRRVELDRVTLRLPVSTRAGMPNDLAPLTISHLPDHPSSVLAPGLVPNPPGNDLAIVADVAVGGWREIDVTAAFQGDWQADRPHSAYAVRLETPTNGDLQADQLRLLEQLEGGGSLEPHLILEFSVDL